MWRQLPVVQNPRQVCQGNCYREQGLLEMSGAVSLHVGVAQGPLKSSAKGGTWPSQRTSMWAVANSSAGSTADGILPAAVLNLLLTISEQLSVNCICLGNYQEPAQALETVARKTHSQTEYSLGG